MVTVKQKPSLKAVIWTPQRICMYLSCICYVIALATPALYLERDQGAAKGLGGWSYGASLLSIGWFGALCGQYGWFANVTFIGAWLSLSSNRMVAARFCGAISVLISLHTLELFRTPIPAFLPASSSEILSKLGVGFYLWVLSMILCVLVTTSRSHSEPNQAVNPSGGSAAP
ncbi:hypothetical protein HG15A2_37900 [Adhaeretor mobilis]|uniref:Uncharacterized protein n=1 Tax=Adhaeretor mobilis TaxID=1930276 RepID=A0A517MZY2_9BACT|nr:hypothetical protein HG15A2_37900 [Adhaeretor mobilis]